MNSELLKLWAFRRNIQILQDKSHLAPQCAQTGHLNTTVNPAPKSGTIPVFGHWVTGKLLPGAQQQGIFPRPRLARWRTKAKHNITYANSCSLGNRLRKWDIRCSTSQNKSLDKKLMTALSTLVMEKPMNTIAVWLKTYCLYSSLPCFHVWAINPLISVLINSLISNWI